MKKIFVVLLLSIYGFRLDAQEIGDVDYEDYEDYYNISKNYTYITSRKKENVSITIYDKNYDIYYDSTLEFFSLSHKLIKE